MNCRLSTTPSTQPLSPSSRSRAPSTHPTTKSLRQQLPQPLLLLQPQRAYTKAQNTFASKRRSASGTTACDPCRATRAGAGWASTRTATRMMLSLRNIHGLSGTFIAVSTLAYEGVFCGAAWTHYGWMLQPQPWQPREEDHVTGGSRGPKGSDLEPPEPPEPGGPEGLERLRGRAAEQLEPCEPRREVIGIYRQDHGVSPGDLHGQLSIRIVHPTSAYYLLYQYIMCSLLLRHRTEWSEDPLVIHPDQAYQQVRNNRVWFFVLKYRKRRLLR
jgi:hypothetical protein